MITSLTIKRFKSWKDAEIKLNRLTGFFGTNSSGKTSILQLLLLLKQSVESTDRAQVLDFGDGKSYVELGTFADVIHNHSLKKSLGFGLEWLLDKHLEIKDPGKKNAILFKDNTIRFNCEIYQTTRSRMVLQYFSYEFAGHKFSMDKQKSGDKYKLNHTILNGRDSPFGFIRSQGRPWSLPHPVKCYGFPDQVNAFFQNAAFLSDLQLQLETLFDKVYYLGPLRDYPKREYTWAGANPSDMGRKGEQVIDAMLASKRRQKVSRGKGRPKLTVEEYVAHWLKELGLIHNFRVHQILKGSNLYRVLVKKTELSPEVLITDVGFGVSQILPVITLCYYAPPNSTLIIEQPEIHLHPSVQAGLADVFIDAIRVKNIQIILESHSEYLLKRLQRRIAEEKFDKKEAALYFCTSANGHSNIEQLDLDSFGNIKNWPKNFFGDEMREMAATAKAIVNRKTRMKHD